MPLTSGIVARVFGPRYMGTLFAIIAGLAAALIHLPIDDRPLARPRETAR